MGIIKRGEHGKNSIKDYYNKLKTDAWQGNTRYLNAPHLGRTGRAKHLHGAAVLGGLYLLGQFRSTEPRLYTAAKYAVAPIVGTTLLGKIANAATDVIRAGQQLGAIPSELTNNYADIPITNNPLKRVKSIFKAEQANINDIRKKYGLQYDGDRSYDSDFGTGTNPDLIPVSFKTNNLTIPVRGVIQSLTDTVTPVWNETGYVGRPQGVVTYGGFTRAMSFDLTLAAINPQQLRPMWHKINDLMKLVLPQSDGPNTRFAGRLTEVTIGDYLTNQLCAVTGLTITPNEESYWEIMDPDVHHPSLTLDTSIGNKLQAKLKEEIRKSRKAAGTAYDRLGNPTKKEGPLTRKQQRKMDAKAPKFIMPRVVTISVGLNVIHNEVPGTDEGTQLFHVTTKPTRPPSIK
tara:strand:- start:1082 stop:2287 length:1206 start_codon:yes stop_codon:yes gene_type:complete